MNIEREGARHLEDIARTARNVPWTVSLLQIAWTAGPVTIVAAVGGYYLGYGKLPTREYLLYFAAYSIIAGIIGLGARLVYEALSAPRKRHERQDLAFVNDLLPDLGFAVRNLLIAQMPPSARRLEAAGILLRHPNLDPESAEVAVMELTGSPHIGAAVRRSEIYRRFGIASRVDDIAAEVAEEAEAALEQLGNTAPHLQPLLRARLKGRPPRPEDGLEREEGFIERLLSAADHEDDSRVTLQDAAEAFMLLFELLNGREILIITYTYRGSAGLARTLDALEARYNRYRTAKMAALGRLKALVALLADCEALDSAVPAPGQSSATMLTQAQRGIEVLADQVEALHQGASTIPRDSPERRRRVAQLAKALRLYDEMHRGFLSVGRRQAVFLQTLNRWKEEAKRVVGKQPALRTGLLGKGLRLSERKIILSDRDKLAVAGEIASQLRSEGIRSQGLDILSDRAGQERSLDTDTAKRLAMQVVSTLSDVIDLGDAAVQRAIDSSRAPNLSALNPGSSVHYKVGLASAMIAEVEDRLDRAAELLAMRLVFSYGVRLDDSAVDVLHRAYGASRERLELLAQRETNDQPPFFSSLTNRPPLDLAATPAWRATLERARALVERYRSDSWIADPYNAGASFVRRAAPSGYEFSRLLGGRP